MAEASSTDLSMKQKVLDAAHELFPEMSRSLLSIGAETPSVPTSMHPAEASQKAGPESAVEDIPKTLVEMTEDALLYKCEKMVSGRRVLIACYNETSHFDNVNFSHNIRIVVACTQSLAVLAVKDFHEDT